MSDQILTDLNTLTTDVLSMRKQYLPLLQKHIKDEKSKNKTKQLYSFYLEPVKVSRKFIRFFKLLPEHPYSRVFCYRKVFEYLKKHQLLTNEEITVIDDIAWLFKGTSVSLQNMDQCLEHHFVSLE